MPVLWKVPKTDDELIERLEAGTFTVEGALGILLFAVARILRILLKARYV